MLSMEVCKDSSQMFFLYSLLLETLTYLIIVSYFKLRVKALGKVKKTSSGRMNILLVSFFIKKRVGEGVKDRCLYAGNFSLERNPVGFAHSGVHILKHSLPTGPFQVTVVISVDNISFRSFCLSIFLYSSSIIQ
jgi:hypothetical protein